MEGVELLCGFSANSDIFYAHLKLGKRPVPLNLRGTETMFLKIKIESKRQSMVTVQSIRKNSKYQRDGTAVIACLECSCSMFDSQHPKWPPEPVLSEL